jgi:hypothetical protein
MAGKSNALAEMFLKLIYKGITDADLADSVGDADTIYFALHTADPTDSGTQNANEPTSAQYPTYTRVGLPRGSGFGDVESSGGASTIHPATPVTFPATNALGTGFVATHFSVGLGASGATKILHSGPISTPMSIPGTTAGIIPQLTTATVIQES